VQTTTRSNSDEKLSVDRADHYMQALVEMLKKKQAGTTVSRSRAAPPAQNVVNLMDALRRSLPRRRPDPLRARKRTSASRDSASC
jgi:non-homologous end joining protein Ku